MYFDQHCYIVAYFQSAFSALVISPSVYQPSQTPYEIIISRTSRERPTKIAKTEWSLMGGDRLQESSHRALFL